MPQCCRCNGKGRCKGCVCVRNGKTCTNCTPGRVGKCENRGSATRIETEAADDQGNAEGASAANALALENDQPRNQGQHSASVPDIERTSVNIDGGGNGTPLLDNRTSGSECATASNRASNIHVDQWPSPACSTPNFQWGLLDGKTFCEKIDEAYNLIIHWKRNIFLLPSGATGKSFIQEITHLLQAFASGSAMESIALKASFVMQVLLLQKPSQKSKSRDHVTHLKRRLEMWKQGDIPSLTQEGRCIQRYLLNRSRPSDDDAIARNFGKMMEQGKVRAALRYLSRNTTGGVLSLDDMIPTVSSSSNSEPELRSTRDILEDKHPAGKSPDPSSLLSSSEPALFDRIIFENLNADTIHHAAMHTHGSAGPSGLDSYAWRRLCSSFGSVSHDLCSALAAVARHLCTTLVNQESISALVACRLIPLDKCPGVRPIGVGEVARRIIAKAILRTIGKDIEEAAGSLQVCAGQDGGCEAAVHAMRSIFQDADTEGCLLVDASNAFNTLNRKTALHNISILCPPLSPVLINTYRAPVRMIIVGSGEISSTEGTTQGDPLAMAMYALAIVPLIHKLRSITPDVKQVWYADDATGAGPCEKLREWWDQVEHLGPTFGYYPNAAKTYLIVKEEHENKAKALFADTDVHITINGKRHLGAALGSNTFTEEYVSCKVGEWVKEIEQLSTIASTQPHAAYAAFTHGLSSHWTYISRTIPDIQDLLHPLERAIHQHLIPALTGRESCSQAERDLLALPTRLGGMGLVNPTNESTHAFEASKRITAPLVALIVTQDPDKVVQRASHQKIKNHVKKMRRVLQEQQAQNILEHLNPQLQRSVELAQEKGSSAWLTVLPVAEHGFLLHKGEFRDAICLRYGWSLSNIPRSCNCGTPFSVNHAMICHMGGIPTIRHNEIRDITATLLTEICHNVATEPPLQPLTNETFAHRSANTEPNARLDIRARGFWNTGQDAFFDVRVFHPNASSNSSMTITAAYRKHELIKKREYAQRVREVEHGVFTPLVMSTTGGMGREAATFYRRLADGISRKERKEYSVIMGWLRCRLSFAILRSAILCIRGSRSSHHRPINELNISLAASEGRVPSVLQ